MIIMERRERILEILEKKRTATIRELAEKLFISEASIRRDVEALEKPLPNDFYCLQLTNDSFLPGQRWRCILSFRESEYMPRYST